MPTGPERAVCLDGHAASLACLEQRPPVFERAELNLIDSRRRARDRDHLFELLDAEVRDSDRARESPLARRLHSRPGPRRPTLGPVNDVQIDLVELEPAEAALDLRHRVPAGRIELRGDEDLLAGDAAVSKRPPDAPLVAVGLRGVDVPVSGLERPANSALALGTIGNLPHAKPEDRDLRAVGEGAVPCGHRPTISRARSPRPGGA